MKYGTLYGIGVGPGDPELITVKGARLLAECKNLFVPKARIKAESAAYSIVEKYVTEKTKIHELLFPMVTDKDELEKRWAESADKIAAVLATGEDAVFVTLGDAMLYSTYIYLIRALRKAAPEAKIFTVPGVTAFSTAAAMTNFPVGVAKEPVTIIPAADDLEAVRAALKGEGTVVLMKVGKRLQNILEELEKSSLIESSVFVAYAGMEGERVETDLRKLKNEDPETGYLSTILVSLGGGK
ncbi:MAG: precorrin-2 C(20)-methyltransferase [Nitrospinae bacterium]|nr:precorrin-2 C(20)-methyltransferase [Nitrospinota bacterium]